MDRNVGFVMPAETQLFIIVKLGNQYGQQVVIPVCETAQKFADLVGTKTLTRQAIEKIKALGYSVQVQPSEPLEL